MKTPRKYRGKYTNARDCKHAKADSLSRLMAMVEVRETCPRYGIMPHNLVPVIDCQQNCQCYEKKEGSDE